MHKPKLSLISTLHYYKLVARSLLFLAATAFYVVNWLQGVHLDLFGRVEQVPWLMAVVWVAYALEMVLRFFPSRVESMGCQKQFARNFKPRAEQQTGQTRLQSGRSTFLVALFWLGLNGIIWVLFLAGLIDEGVLLLVSLFYGVCDMICILFFCPFQTWIMKNKCCSSCRIYNWDYAMMFTPLVLVRSGYTASLVMLSLILLVRWELAVRLHPERFLESTNAALCCANCSEKLCHHKRQLRQFWQKSGRCFQLAGNQLLTTAEEVKHKLYKK